MLYYMNSTVTCSPWIYQWCGVNCSSVRPSSSLLEPARCCPRPQLPEPGDTREQEMWSGCVWSRVSVDLQQLVTFQKDHIFGSNRHYYSVNIAKLWLLFFDTFQENGSHLHFLPLFRNKVKTLTQRERVGLVPPESQSFQNSSVPSWLYRTVKWTFTFSCHCSRTALLFSDGLSKPL